MSSCDQLASQCPAHTQALDFIRDGFVLLKGFLDKSESSRVQTLVASTLRMPLEQACIRPHNTLIPLRWNDPIVQVFLMSEHRVQALNDALVADDLKWISGYISIK